MADNFDKKLASEQSAGRKARLEDAPPIGALPDGSIGVYKPGEVPPYEPEIVGADDSDDDEVEDAADLEGDA